MNAIKSKLYWRLRESFRNSFSVREVWFDEEPKEVDGVDVFYYCQRTNPIRGIRCNEYYTIWIDLTKNQDELWEDIGKHTRYQIRRAEKDWLVYEFWNTDDSDILNQFSDFYSKFALQKGLSTFNKTRITNLMDIGALDVSRIKSKDGETLVWHAYYRNKTRSSLLYSASTFRSSTDNSYRRMVGRANRYHHWQDILKYKNLGLLTYDFGGWYAGHEDREKIGINKFKEEFGGKPERSFNCVRSITMKGKLYLRLREILTKDD